jgi:ABC-type dipeptide/oligopeptide/nickel transport system permease subunit
MKVQHSRNVVFYIAVCYLIFIGVAAIAAPLLAPHNPTEQNLSLRFSAPDRTHVMGTDNFGRDIMSRLFYGSRSVFVVGIVTVTIAVAIGMVVGLLAGLAGNLVDNVLMLIMDSVLSFPTVILAITVVSFLGYGLAQVMIALGVIFSPVFARLVRAETLSIKTEGYVEASRALGSPWLKIIYKHIIPNLLGRVVVQCSIVFAMAVVLEASLSFLGLGTQPPNPSWGLMLKDARNYLVQAPWMAIYPGVFLAMTVLSFNILGDVLSEKINPRIQ